MTEKEKAYQSEWAKKNREKRRLAEYKWRAKNKDKVKQYNKKAGSKWAKNNKAVKNYHSSLRRASIRAATPAWADLDKIKEIYIEAARLTAETGIPHEVDHIIPLQGETVTGLHVHNNLQILTQEENRRKRNCVY